MWTVSLALAGVLTLLLCCYSFSHQSPREHMACIQNSAEHVKRFPSILESTPDFLEAFAGAVVAQSPHLFLSNISLVLVDPVKSSTIHAG